MDTLEKIQRLYTALSDYIITSRQKVKHYGKDIYKITVWFNVDKEVFHSTINILKGLGKIHISTPIIHKEYDDRIELLYPFALKMSDEKFSEIMVIVSVDVPKDNFTIRTITDIIPGAIFMEREAMEMIGLHIEDIPDSRRLFTSDLLPQNFYPMRNVTEGKK